MPSEQERLDTLHLQIGQLFEANVSMAKAIEGYKAGVAQRDELIASLRQELAAATAEKAVPEKATARGK